MSQGLLFPAAPAPPPSAGPHRALSAVRPARAISLTQPWASLVAAGAKRVETRSWPTAFRGPIAIHAAKGFPASCRALCAIEPYRSALGGRPWRELPVGAVVAVAALDDCWRFPDSGDPLGGRAGAPHELDFGDYAPGRWGFLLRGAVPVADPIPCRGMLGIWTLPESAADAAAAGTAAAGTAGT